MALPYSSESIPETRTGAFALLESVGFELKRLTEVQRQQIRVLYRLDDSRSISQLITDGEV